VAAVRSVIAIPQRVRVVVARPLAAADRAVEVVPEVVGVRVEHLARVGIAHQGGSGVTGGHATSLP
jgi:hypothetical protein